MIGVTKYKANHQNNNFTRYLQIIKQNVFDKSSDPKLPILLQLLTENIRIHITYRYSILVTAKNSIIIIRHFIVCCPHNSISPPFPILGQGMMYLFPLAWLQDLLALTSLYQVFLSPPHSLSSGITCFLQSYTQHSSSIFLMCPNTSVISFVLAFSCSSIQAGFLTQQTTSYFSATPQKRHYRVKLLTK